MHCFKISSNMLLKLQFYSFLLKVTKTYLGPMLSLEGRNWQLICTSRPWIFSLNLHITNLVINRLATFGKLTPNGKLSQEPGAVFTHLFNQYFWWGALFDKVERPKYVNIVKRRHPCLKSDCKIITGSFVNTAPGSI